jgi:hypothetical protein
MADGPMVTPACLLKLGSSSISVCGRFRRTMACTNKPLCGSRNQDVVFFSDRYSQEDLQPQGYEVTISENCATAIITGFPPAGITD